MENRKFHFNAWIPKLNVMLEEITFYSNRMIGIDYGWFKEEAENADLVVQYEDVYNKKGEKLMELIMAEEWIFFDPKDYVILQFSGYVVKYGKYIFDGDICEIIDDLGKKIYVICEYGTARRYMINGDNKATVDVEGFYFIRPDGKATFPIVKNYAGKHDLEIMEKVGNIYQNPELI